MTTEYTKADIARHLDMSERNLTEVLRGLNIDWRTVHIDDIRTAYIKDLREKAAGRGGDHQIDAAIARTRKDNIAADLMTMTMQEKAGVLVPISRIEPYITSAVIAARQALMSFPKKWVQELKAIKDVDIDELYFETDINDALNQLATTDLSCDDEDDTPHQQVMGSAREIADLTMGD